MITTVIKYIILIAQEHKTIFFLFYNLSFQKIVAIYCNKKPYRSPEKLDPVPFYFETFNYKILKNTVKLINIPRSDNISKGKCNAKQVLLLKKDLIILCMFRKFHRNRSSIHGDIPIKPDFLPERFTVTRAFLSTPAVTSQ